MTALESYNKIIIRSVALIEKSIKNLEFLWLLKENERRLRIAIKTCNSKSIVLKNEHEVCTMNVNTKKELKAVENEYNH